MRRVRSTSSAICHGAHLHKHQRQMFTSKQIWLNLSIKPSWPTKGPSQTKTRHQDSPPLSCLHNASYGCTLPNWYVQISATWCRVKFWHVSSQSSSDLCRTTTLGAVLFLESGKPLSSSMSRCALLLHRSLMLRWEAIFHQVQHHTFAVLCCDVSTTTRRKLSNCSSAWLLMLQWSTNNTL